VRAPSFWGNGRVAASDDDQMDSDWMDDPAIAPNALPEDPPWPVIRRVRRRLKRATQQPEQDTLFGNRESEI
jgi:hypothetical protein